MSPSDVLRFLDSLELPPGGVVLLLGHDRETIEQTLADRGFDVWVLDADRRAVRSTFAAPESNVRPDAIPPAKPGRDFTFPHERLDAVLALRFVEHLDWDRWVLQQLHAALKPGGILFLTATNQFPLRSLMNPLWWIRKISGRVVRSMPKKLRQRAPSKDRQAKAAPKRLYSSLSMKLLLENLEFQMLSTQSYGYAPPGSPGKPDTFGNVVTAIARSPLLPGSYQGGNTLAATCRKPEQTADTFGARTRAAHFRHEQRELIDALEQWRGKHPALAPGKSEKLNLDALNGPVLVLSPHPDDEIIGCGGTLISLIERGIEVTILQLTDGGTSIGLRGHSEEEKRTVRFVEARTVADLLGAKELITWPIPGEELSNAPEVVADMEKVLDRIRPEWIFCPFINDPHPDHYVANTLLADALGRRSSGAHPSSILWYQVWSLVPSNVYVPVDAAMEQKFHLLMQYETGMKPVDYIRFCKDLHAYDARQHQCGATFAESFLQVDTPSFLALTAQQVEQA